MRVYAVSDLHLDHPSNAEWLFSLNAVYRNDILILAGDISDKRELIAACFEHLKDCFSQVLFVPGNHDIWVHRDSLECSLEKFYYLQELATQFGVCTGVYEAGTLSIVPLLGWYDFSFSKPSVELRSRWMDFYACTWPDTFDEQHITHMFAEMNLPHMEIENEHIISFSHFLPRIDVMPAFIPGKHRLVYPVLGSKVLEKQIRQLGSSIHVYGHSHVNRITRLDGVTYVNNAFGTPAEARITRKALLPIWNSATYSELPY